MCKSVDRFFKLSYWLRKFYISKFSNFFFSSEKIKKLSSNVMDIDEYVVALYQTVGENLDFLNSNNLKLDFLYRKLDQYS